MPHVSIGSVPTYPCNCPPVPDCIGVVSPTEVDPTIAQGLLTVPTVQGNLTFNYFDILPSGGVSITCAATPVAQVNTIAPSSFTVGDCCGNETTYTLQLSQVQCETQIAPSVYELQVTTDQTAADIVDSFVALINADTNAFVTAADTGSTFTITADTAGCAFVVDFVSTNLVNIASTANVVGAGQTANLTYYGVDSDDFSAAATYHTVQIKYRAFKTNPIDMRALHGCEECKIPCVETCLIFVINDSDGDSYLDALTTITQGSATASLYFARGGDVGSC